MIKYKYR